MSEINTFHNVCKSKISLTELYEFIRHIHKCQFNFVKLYVPLFVGVLCWYLLWYALLYFLSSFAIILTRKREQVDLLVFWMSCYCKCPVALPHGASLHVVIVVFPDHTYLLFVFLWSQFS